MYFTNLMRAQHNRKKKDEQTHNNDEKERVARVNKNFQLNSLQQKQDVDYVHCNNERGKNRKLEARTEKLEARK